MTYGPGERGGEGEMYGKSNMETYITICKIDYQWEFAVWLRKLKQGLCINIEGWDGLVGSSSSPRDSQESSPTPQFKREGKYYILMYIHGI